MSYFLAALDLNDFAVLSLCVCAKQIHVHVTGAFPYLHQTCLTWMWLQGDSQFVRWWIIRKSVLYSGKYGIWEILYSRIFPDKLLVAQMTQEIPWHFCNLTSYYKTENGWFMKDETSDIEYWKTHKLYHIVSQHCRICL